MGPPSVRRRPDGIVQIRPRPLWRCVAGPVPAALLALFAGITLVMAGLIAAVAAAPLTTAVIGGSAALGLWAVRWMRTPVAAEVPVTSPPRDAA